MKAITILGSSGSIGASALRVVAAHPKRYRIAGLAVRRASDKLLEQARQFGVDKIAIADKKAAQALRRSLPRGMRLLAGAEGVAELAATAEADIVLCAMVGMAGLAPVLAAMRAGRHIALATKEVLVAAGAIVMRERSRHNVSILPVDSEHSAIFQCLQSSVFTPRCVRHADAPVTDYAEARIRRLLLTASGGPFAGQPDVDFERVTAAKALQHPRWSMGRKISVDSATMMNKGLEIMEAHWLFNVPLADIEVLLHLESVVHSLVEFRDRSLVAQLSQPDMRFAIQYALDWPDRRPASLPPLDLARLSKLHFANPDAQRFPCLRLARAAAQAGGTQPAMLNAANEVAVEAFLAGRLSFAGIWRTVEGVMNAAETPSPHPPSLEAIVAADYEARRMAADLAGWKAAVPRIQDAAQPR